MKQEGRTDGSLHIRLRQRRGKGKVDLFQAPIIRKLQGIAWGETPERERGALPQESRVFS